MTSFSRTVCGAFACWLLLLVITSSSAFAQTGFDRPGGDFTSFPIASGDPAQCAARCDREGRCRSWSFVYPNPGAATGVCWLKRRVPRRVQSACCVTGVKGSGVVEPQLPNIEYGIDRTGGDLRSFDVEAHEHGETCANVCKAENGCRAWTYARPGYGSASARCYLKNRVTAPRRKPCCISGVVR